MARKKIQTEITVGQIPGILRAMPEDVSVMFWGPPGIGKTFSVYEAFQDTHQIYNVLAGCSEPTDFGGIPERMKGDDARAFEHLPPHWAWVASKGYYENFPMVIFLDDVVTADEQTQAALYKAVHERRVGREEFRDNVRIILAGNRVEDRSAAQDMPLALANRMVHFNVRVDFAEWQSWAVGAGIHPVVVGYLRSQEQDLSTFEDAVDKNIKVFATPRSWEIFSKALFRMEKVDGGDDLKLAVACGTVGDGIAPKFLAFWRNSKNLIPPEDIIRDPENAKVHDMKDLDAAHATIATLEAHVMKKATAYNMERSLIYAMRLNPELGVALGLNLIKVIGKKAMKAEELSSLSDKEVFGKALKKWSKFM